MKRIYINKKDVRNVLAEITREQAARKTFVNVQVKEYCGKKYDPAETVVVVIG